MSNPYESPLTPPDANPTRFRWRTIPVGLLGGIGLLICLMGLFVAFALLFHLVAGRELYKPGPTFSLGGCAASLLVIGVGTLFLYASQQWRLGRWKRSLVIVAAIIGLSQLATMLGFIPD